MIIFSMTLSSVGPISENGQKQFLRSPAINLWGAPQIYFSVLQLLCRDTEIEKHDLNFIGVF